MFNFIRLVKLNEFQRMEAVLLLCQYSKHNDLCEFLIWKSIEKVNTGSNSSIGKNYKLTSDDFLKYSSYVLELIPS